LIGIVDYGLGNLFSVKGAVEHLGFDVLVSGDKDELSTCEKLILPGVGAFGDGMENLRQRGLVDTLNGLVQFAKTPILGICLGAQLMTRGSEEFGNHDGLGWLDADVKKIEPNDPSLRVPHVGWSNINIVQDSLLFCGLDPEPLFYFVHSFWIQSRTPKNVVATGDYGGPFAIALASDNIYAVQFHPEKSQKDGLAVLMNFLKD